MSSIISQRLPAAFIALRATNNFWYFTRASPRREEGIRSVVLTVVVVDVMVETPLCL